MDVYKNYFRMDYDVIIAAIKQGDASTEKSFDKKLTTVNLSGKNGETGSPLFETAACGRDDIVKGVDSSRGECESSEYRRDRFRLEVVRHFTGQRGHCVQVKAK